MTDNNQKYIAAKGGKGGLGNNNFKSSTNRAPRKFTDGEEGSEFWIWLSLKLIADVGIVGLPNAGKSTLLSKISSAHPKIANYPFTTLHPVLGVVKDSDYDFVAADIPGLIKGAHEGKGLGDQFLAHIERCKIIIHLIDINSPKPMQDYNIIRNELKKYSSKLLKKREIIVLSKIDLFEKNIENIKKIFNKTNNNVLTISSNNKLDQKKLIKKIKKELSSYINEII
tara:strand:- start:598 stop:1275 length:678 start_codon:yes stop_codon:yes gene_type:complete